VLFLCKLALEMTFNIFSTKWVSCFAQHDRIDDLIPFSLRGHKRAIFCQFLVDKLHFSAIFKCFDPLFVAHFAVLQGRSVNVASIRYSARMTTL